MIQGLDTNLLIRYLVKDDVRQAKKASDAIKKLVTSGGRCFINRVVLCEMVWVLESAYRYSKREILDVLNMMLRTKQFEIESKDIIRQAVDDYNTGRGDLADYIIARVNRANGCDTTLTFDRAVKNNPIFSVIE